MQTVYILHLKWNTLFKAVNTSSFVVLHDSAPPLHSVQSLQWELSEL